MNNYEIHITVPVDPYHKERLQRFEEVADLIGVKAIVLDAYPLKEVMTSFRKFCSQGEAFHAMTQQALMLGAYGFEPIRCKVETELHHPWALTPMPNQYFESHIQVLLDDKDMMELKGLQEGIQFFLSHNINKPRLNGKQVHIITVREYHTTPERFSTRIEAFVRVLMREGFTVISPVENEFALYDTNPEHDRPWFEASTPCSLPK